MDILALAAAISLGTEYLKNLFKDQLNINGPLAALITILLSFCVSFFCEWAGFSDMGYKQATIHSVLGFLSAAGLYSVSTTRFDHAKP